jgi:hypothetical protein
VPGAFDVVTIESIDAVADGESVVFEGPGVLTFDGERQHVLATGSRATITVRHDGPHVVDVERALCTAVARRLFDVADEED